MPPSLLPANHEAQRTDELSPLTAFKVCNWMGFLCWIWIRQFKINSNSISSFVGGKTDSRSKCWVLTCCKLIVCILVNILLLILLFNLIKIMYFSVHFKYYLITRIVQSQLIMFLFISPLYKSLHFCSLVVLFIIYFCYIWFATMKPTVAS